MSCNSTVVANPDIAGKGVRYAIYAQAGLALLPVLMLSLTGQLYDGFFEDEDLADDIQVNSTAVLATGVALLVTSFIQQGRDNLDVYNAIIVLQLSWLNNLTAALPTLIFAFFKKATLRQRIINALKTMVLFTLHCTATGVFGFLLFLHIQDWSGGGCADDYSLVVLGQTIPTTSEALRVVVLIVSGTAAVPVVNFVLICIAIGTVYLFTTLWCEIGGHDRGIVALVIVVIAWTVPSVILADSTEQFIMYNSRMVVDASDQNDWEFGQILALILLAFPVWSLIVRVVKMATRFIKWRRKRVDDGELASALISEPAPDIALDEMPRLTLTPPSTKSAISSRAPTCGPSTERETEDNESDALMKIGENRAGESTVSLDI